MRRRADISLFPLLIRPGQPPSAAERQRTKPSLPSLAEGQKERGAKRTTISPKNHYWLCFALALSTGYYSLALLLSNWRAVVSGGKQREREVFH